MTNGTALSGASVQAEMETLAREAGSAGQAFSVPSPEGMGYLLAYLELVMKWNRVMNLVGPYSWQETMRILLVDSFYLAPFLETLALPDAPRCWDLGAGAGLPGIPLRMVWPKGEYSLVEAREKRAVFLQTVLVACPLLGVHVVRGRAEAFMAGQPPAHLVVSRAFLPWEKVLAMVADHMEPQGYAVFLTLTAVPEALPPGWTVAGEKRYSIGQAIRYFWALQKQ